MFSWKQNLELSKAEREERVKTILRVFKNPANEHSVNKTFQKAHPQEVKEYTTTGKYTQALTRVKKEFEEFQLGVKERREKLGTRQS